MSLKLDLLENVRPRGDGFQSACPACRQAGKDRAGDNLRAWPSGSFHCIVGSESDPGHNAAIFRLAGTKDGTRPLTPRRESNVQADWMPDFDATRRSEALRDVGSFTVAQLAQSSPWPNPESLSPTRALSLLFRAIWTPLLWAPEPWEHAIAPIYQVQSAERIDCVSPSIPAGSGAQTPREDGRPSPACEANFPTRHFLVTEFDSGTLDEQAALIESLRGRNCARLAAVVFSGSKSLHAWWDYRGRPEKDALNFLRFAVALGADPAYRKRSHRTRTPNAVRRRTRQRQTLVYLEPAEATR